MIAYAEVFFHLRQTRVFVSVWTPRKARRRLVGFGRRIFLLVERFVSYQGVILVSYRGAPGAAPDCEQQLALITARVV